ncbi:MAG: phospholipase D-like domain-containing protein [Burkholderiaceae bacterium]
MYPTAETSPLRLLAEQALSRSAGAPLLGGNTITLLKDAEQNYPAWLRAIAEAQYDILFENYIVHDDRIGRSFADALIEAARRGVQVRVLYDWLGCLRTASRAYWDRLRQYGIEVRAFNPLSLESPFGWISRNHRKSLCVDDRVAFVSGLCIGRMWAGDPERGTPPWRDTGVEVRGPAVAEVVRAFARAWASVGEPIPADELPEPDRIEAAGEVSLRVLASMPQVAGLYRLDQMIAALARDSLWLTDAYFVGTASYVQALCQAAIDGVDVRLLVPGASDIPALSPISRAGYRPLLEAGVRVFEWNGPMLHAKTAVADGRWARVGSSNLNLASWLGNWELDIAAEDAGFAAEMEATYLQDLEGATEILLGLRNRVRAADPDAAAQAAERRRQRRAERRAQRRAGNPDERRASGGSASQIAAGAIRVGNTFGAALTNRRVLGAAEARTMVIAAAILAVIAVIAILWPRLLAWPLAVLAAWSMCALLLRAWHLHRAARDCATHRQTSDPDPG